MFRILPPMKVPVQTVHLEDRPQVENRPHIAYISDHPAGWHSRRKLATPPVGRSRQPAAAGSLGAIRKVRYAPIVEPTVATTAYSYHGSLWVETRIATRMSGPQKSWQRRAIENSEKKKPECAQVAEYRKDGVPTIRSLEQNV